MEWLLHEPSSEKNSPFQPPWSRSGCLHWPAQTRLKVRSCALKALISLIGKLQCFYLTFWDVQFYKKLNNCRNKKKPIYFTLAHRSNKKMCMYVCVCVCAMSRLCEKILSLVLTQETRRLRQTFRPFVAGLDGNTPVFHRCAAKPSIAYSSSGIHKSICSSLQWNIKASFWQVNKRLLQEQRWDDKNSDSMQKEVRRKPWWASGALFS